VRSCEAKFHVAYKLISTIIITLYYTLEHMYDNIMVCSILRLIVYPSPLHL